MCQINISVRCENLIHEAPDRPILSEFPVTYTPDPVRPTADRQIADALLRTVATASLFAPPSPITTMTRFEADTPAERRKLFADAVVAHRNRGSAFLTIEAEPLEDEADDEEPAPWIQFAEKTFNMDCGDAELDRLKALLEEFPEFRIDQIESPEEAEGTNVRITARSDANRLAGFVDRAFQEIYERPESYRAWVVAI